MFKPKQLLLANRGKRMSCMELSKLIRKNILQIKPYIPGKPIEDVERELGLTNVIKMASNENPLGPGKAAIEALQKGAAKVHLYPDGNCYYLKKALAQKHGVEADNIIVGNGSDEILKMLGETFLNQGDQCIMADPTFSEYGFVATLMDAESISIPLKDFKHDLARMKERITEKTKLVFICSPNNPTGNIVTKAELDEFFLGLPDNIIVVLDEAYHEYVESPNYYDSLAYLKAGKRVIILRTFSKIYGLGGLRIGYGIASQEMIDLLNRVREPFNVNQLAQVAALAALEDQEHVEKSLEVNREGKEFLSNKFTEMGLFYIPTETNFILVQIGIDSKTFFQEMLKRGIIIRTGDIFGLPDFIRVTIGTPEQNQRFIENTALILENLK